MRAGMLCSPSRTSTSTSCMAYRTSKPATQNNTAPARSHGPGSNTAADRTAMAAATGLIAKLAPSHTWQSMVNRLNNPYEQIQNNTGNASASGHQLFCSTPNIPHNITNAADAANSATRTCQTATRPAGNARETVRGLRASMPRSSNRFATIAAVRALTMHPTTRSAESDNARQSIGPCGNATNAPKSANGSANTECESLMSLAISRAAARPATVTSKAPQRLPQEQPSEEQRNSLASLAADSFHLAH